MKRRNFLGSLLGAAAALPLAKSIQLPAPKETRPTGIRTATAIRMEMERKGITRFKNGTIMSAEALNRNFEAIVAMALASQSTEVLKDE